MGNKKNRNPEKKERKRIEKQQQQMTFPVQSNNDEAIKFFEEGRERVDEDEHEKAIKLFTTLIELFEDTINYDEKHVGICATNYLSRGNAYLIKGDHDLAIRDFDKAIEIDPNNAVSYINRGNAHIGKGEYTKAIEDYNEAIEISPNDAGIYSNRGNIYSYNEEYDLAIKDYDKAIEISPNDANSYHNKGFALIILGENEDTKKNYKEWTTKATEHYIKWLEISIHQNIVDYTTSMVIYQLQYLLLKEKDNVSIPKISEPTKKYINKIVKFEHDKNERKIKEYSTKIDDNKKPLIIDKQGNIILYKYSSYDKNAIYNIKQRQMHFSDPSKFNDPFDPLIRVLDKEHSTGLMELLNFRVSCLSPKTDNLLLWSHYADKHQGICIAYDITKLIEQNNVIFRKIEHIDEFQKPQEGLMFASLNTANELNNSATLIDTFTQKQRVWDYEDEYRLILQTDKEDEFLQEVPIKEIYLGRDMPTEDKKFIKDMVNEMNLNRAKGKSDIIVYSMDVSDDDIFKLVPTLEK